MSGYWLKLDYVFQYAEGPSTDTQYRFILDGDPPPMDPDTQMGVLDGYVDPFQEEASRSWSGTMTVLQTSEIPSEVVAKEMHEATVAVRYNTRIMEALRPHLPLKEG